MVAGDLVPGIGGTTEPVRDSTDPYDALDASSRARSGGRSGRSTLGGSNTAPFGTSTTVNEARGSVAGNGSIGDAEMPRS